MNRKRISNQLLLYFLMLMLLMVTVGCSSSDDDPAPAAATTYTVTFDSQSADVAANPTSKTVTAPATTVGTLPAAPTKTGYNFAGWFTAESGSGTQFTATTAVTANITVYAYWTTSDVYTVTYDSQGGTTVGAQYVVSGGTVGTLPAAPTKTGYIFDSWNTKSDGSGITFTGATTVTEADGNITVYAQWDSYSYTVTFDSQSADVAANPTSKTVASPATTVDALPTPPTKADYTFAGWFTAASGGGTQFTATTAVTANITVYAKWTTSTVYTVTYDSQGGTSVSPQQVVSGGTVGTLPADPTRTGYTFGGWYTATSGGGTQFTGSTVVTGNITVYAKWTATGTAGTAAGTFTYADGSVTMTWTSSNFPCNGPDVGTEVSPVTITTTTMTMDEMTWTRSPAGLADDPRGTWTATENGNTYTLVVTGSTATSGSLDLTANIVTCVWVGTNHQEEGGYYGVWLGYEDPAPAVTSVSATGTGISGSQPLTYNSSDEEWEYSIDLGTSPPALPYTYNVTITDGGTSRVETATASCFVENFATPLFPTGSVATATPTFSWTAVSDAGAVYRVFVGDNSGQVWESEKTNSTSVTYNGPPLTPQVFYWYSVQVHSTTACKNGQSNSSSVSFFYAP